MVGQQRARRAPLRKLQKVGGLQRDIALNAQQYEFVFSPERFSFYVGGVGAGKTYSGALRAVIRSQEHPGSLGLICAPTYALLRDASLRTFFELLPESLIKRYDKTHKHLFLRNGSEILFRSSDEPDRLRSVNLAWFWLDEAPQCGYYAWQVLKGRLRQRGFEPSGWATGTPNGRDGYFRDFEQAPLPHHQLLRAATRENLHNLPPGYIEDLGYTGAFAEQEIEGQFVAYAGLVYRFDGAADGNLRAAPPETAFGRVVGGIDWGYHNPVAAVVFGLDGDGRAWQRDEYYQARIGLDDVVIPALLDLTRRYGVAVWHCGPDEPEHIEKLDAALAREGLACRADRANNAVVPGIQTVTRLLARRADGTHGLYVDPQCACTIAEYGAYQYEPAERAARTGRDPAERPIKRNDHALDATRYALHTELGQQAQSEAYLARLVRQRAHARAAAGEA